MIVEITPVEEEDFAAIDALLRAAFDGEAEAAIVSGLRARDDLVLELAAREEGRLVGHVAFSRLVSDPPRLSAICLAPLAVDAAARRRGIGHRLVETGLAQLRELGEDVVLVLGDPDYYGRFGFSARAALAYRTPFDGPYQQALWLGGAREPDEATLAYSAAFS